MKTYTAHELKIEVSKFYNGNLTLAKCLKLFEIEYGFKPTIIKEKPLHFCVNTAVIKKHATCDAINEENLIFMKKLQEGGSVNMFAARHEIQKHLGIDSNSAKSLLMFYMKHYTEIYYPEELI